MVLFSRIGDVFYLIHWGEEETISIHSDAEITAKENCVGAFCKVPFGKQGKEYMGKIAYIGKTMHESLSSINIIIALRCTGSKAEMISQEKCYIKGDFTPFELSKLSGFRNHRINPSDTHAIAVDGIDEDVRATEATVTTR